MIAKILRRKLFLFAALLSCVLSSFAHAQQAPVNSPLLDHLAGHWVLKGTVAGEQTTHDVDAEWALDHHYLRIHEVSREKNDQGKPKYEALVFIAWNEQPKQYACAWLDVLGGLAAESIGVATPKENEIPFVFKNEKGIVSLTNDFLYHPSSDTWDWSIDNVGRGSSTPFARVQLTRAEH
jgi:hypothetical protein